MKMVITIPYRPTKGSFSGVLGPLVQLEDKNWEYTNPNTGKRELWNLARPEDEDIGRCIRSINKNSRYKHDILVLIDYDVEFRKDWEKQFGDNVKVFKTNNQSCSHVPQAQQMYALKESALSLDDSILLCYALNSDTVVSKNWDLYIEEAYNILEQAGV